VLAMLAVSSLAAGFSCRDHMKTDKRMRKQWEEAVSTKNFEKAHDFLWEYIDVLMSCTHTHGWQDKQEELASGSGSSGSASGPAGSATGHSGSPPIGNSGSLHPSSLSKGSRFMEVATKVGCGRRNAGCDSNFECCSKICKSDASCA